MSEKKAFIFDTNFIIQNSQLNEVVENLKNDYTVYVTQVSIDERIAQQCRKIKIDYDEVEKCIEKHSSFAKITLLKTYDEECTIYKKGMQEKYQALFGNNIIPFLKNEETFSAILERANKKTPPFSNAKDASDKGFKDCLLWLSLLKYFKNNGEMEVIFVTDDKSAFRNYAVFLVEEFKNTTGKDIKIMPNSYYKDLLQHADEKQDEEKTTDLNRIANLDILREEIQDNIDCLRWYMDEDFWGNPQWSKTFSISQLFDKESIKTIFRNLESIVNNHALEKSLAASEIFDYDEICVTDKTEIPIDNLINALKTYQKVLSQYSDYEEQFYEAATKILNRNYEQPSFVLDDDGLPF